jgi:hypothetical protein
MNYEKNQTQNHYSVGEVGSDDRDKYDENVATREKDFRIRHVDQLEAAAEAEASDQNWVEDRQTIQQLNENIRIRKSNYDTYMNAMNVEKELYNRERHRTLLLGIANVAALGGCVAMWAM